MRLLRCGDPRALFNMSEMKVILHFMNTANINVTMLRVLVSLSETRSFSRTAERLHLTQSAVSHAVRGFEAIVGVPLVLRDRKGASLTAAGEKALASARNALEAIAQIGRIAEKPVKGNVRLALTNSSSVKIAPAVLAAAARYPALKIEILLGTDQEVAEWVEHGAADIGLSFEAGNCRADPLLHDELYVVSSLQQARHGAFTLQDLDSEAFIMSTGGCAPMLTALFEAARVRPRIVLSANDMSALFALVGAGHGVSVIPGHSFPGDWTRLVQRNPLNPRVIRPLWMLDAFRPRDEPSFAVLKTMISDAAAQLGRGNPMPDEAR